MNQPTKQQALEALASVEHYLSGYRSYGERPEHILRRYIESLPEQGEAVASARVEGRIAGLQEAMELCNRDVKDPRNRAAWLMLKLDLRQLLEPEHRAYPQTVSTPQPAPEDRALREAVGNLLEGWTLPHDVRKYLETAYFNPAAITSDKS